MFNDLQPAPPDAILGLTDAFKSDSNPLKINLGVGVFKDESGSTPILSCVKEAEKVLLADQATKSYLPITGDPAYGQHVQTLLFGEPLDRAASAHTPGGTGALRVGADFIRNHASDATVWVSSPTWANHKGVFSAAGLKLADYPYYDAATHGVDEAALFDCLRAIPAGDVVLLHVCCHNPTGVDLTPAQWAEVAAIQKTAGWTPFFDFAYQGFCKDVESDRAAIKPFIESGCECFVANSFSKNFGLYNERVGGFTVVAESADACNAAFSHVKTAIRVNYSNPSSHGGEVVRTILDRSDLTEQWLGELAAMRSRIKDMRTALVTGLSSRGVDQDFSYIQEQQGMFSFSGLTDSHVAFLRNEKSIYIVGGGRINVAGVTPSNLDYLCDSIAESLS